MPTTRTWAGRPPGRDAFAAAMLDLADVTDRWLAGAAGARLRMQAQLARAFRGLPPLELPAGPATPHRVIAEQPLARLLHYPRAAGTARRTPMLVVASLIN